MPKPTPSQPSTHLCNSSESKLGASASKREDRVLGAHEDITVNILGSRAHGLQRAEALDAGAGDGAEVEDRGRDERVGGADLDGEGGEVLGAVEDVAALGGRVGCGGDLGVVVVGGGVGDEEEGGSGVGDTGVAGRRVHGGADLVVDGVELPEAVGVIDVGVDDGAGVVRGVSEAEVVFSVSLEREVGGEELGVERGLGTVKEGCSGGAGDSVNAAEGKTDESVRSVGDESG